MYFNCSICIIRSSDTIFPLNYIVQGIVELAFEEKKITNKFQLMEAEMFRSLKPTIPWFAKFAMEPKPNCLFYT